MANKTLNIIVQKVLNKIQLNRNKFTKFKNNKEHIGTLKVKYTF